MGPTLSAGPTTEDIQAITCPFQRVIAVTRLSRAWGTLPGKLHDLRRQDLIALRETHSAGAIAIRVNLSRGRIFQLTKPGQTETRRPLSIPGGTR